MTWTTSRHAAQGPGVPEVHAGRRIDATPDSLAAGKPPEREVLARLIDDLAAPGGAERRARLFELSRDEILGCRARGYDRGFRTFVLQGGEDP